jgi:Tol biopolymer transport system component
MKASCCWLRRLIRGIVLLSLSCSLFEARDPNSIDDDPAWSPDGRTIAFVRYSSRDNGLYVVGANGGNPRLLLAGGFCTPCWSPDSRWLVFSTAYEGRMYKVRVNGDSLTPLTDSSDAECFFPDWSSAGMIVFHSNKDDPRGAHVLWLMRPDGSGKDDISQHGVGEWLMPSWSPDGSRIVFSRWYPAGPSEPDLAIVDSAGMNEMRLTADTAFDEHPTWAPDGQRIAFSTSESKTGLSSYRICVLSLEDGTRECMTEGGAFAPAWSPDGRHICYSQQWATGDSGPYQVFVEHGKLWVIGSDGSNARQLTH